MPLLDHFHAPLSPRRSWESFHSTWAGVIADALNGGLLPEGYFAEELTHSGPRVEIDVATMRDPAGGRGGTATLPCKYAPPAPSHVLAGAFPTGFEGLGFQDEGGARLGAAIELVSPANKDRPSHRRAFAIKCASYLVRGVALLLVDVVTSRSADLHGEIVGLLGQSAPLLPPSPLYASAFRPIVREGEERIDVWTQGLALGRPLPTMPLALHAGTCLPIELEETYTEACRRRRLP